MQVGTYRGLGVLCNHTSMDLQAPCHAEESYKGPGDPCDPLKLRKKPFAQAASSNWGWRVGMGVYQRALGPLPTTHALQLLEPWGAMWRVGREAGLAITKPWL